MAQYCLDMRTGQLRLWPQAGGWHDQDVLELAAMYQAWKVYTYLGNPKSRDWPGFERVLLDIYEALEAEKTT